MSITTRNGDDGTTRLYTGERVSKADPRMDALGDLDELVSALGMARSHSLPSALHDAVLGLQRDLFRIGAVLASADGARAGNPLSVPSLDAQCAALEAEIEHPRGFILPGETPAGACLDLARSVSRRLERRVVGLPRTESASPQVLAWLNRVSDYLWLLARAAEGRSRPLKGDG